MENAIYRNFTHKTITFSENCVYILKRGKEKNIKIKHVKHIFFLKVIAFCSHLFALNIYPTLRAQIWMLKGKPETAFQAVCLYVRTYIR